MEENGKQKVKDLSRRQIWQVYQYIEKSLAWVVANRARNREGEIYKNLDEMVAILHGSRVRLSRICKELYDCELKDLEVYK